MIKKKINFIIPKYNRNQHEMINHLFPNIQQWTKAKKEKDR